MPVNLVTGFANGDISYHMLASLFDQPSGNQVIDGTKASQDKQKLSITQTKKLPYLKPQSGFIVAANNQAAMDSRPVTGTVRSMRLNQRLGSLTQNRESDARKLQTLDMERILLDDVTDAFATSLINQNRLGQILSQQAINFTLPEQEKINLIKGLLHNFDGQFRAESIEATVFTFYF